MSTSFIKFSSSSFAFVCDFFITFIAKYLDKYLCFTKYTIPKEPRPNIFFLIYNLFGSLLPFAIKTFESRVTTCLSSEASFIALFSSLISNLSFVGCSLKGKFAFILLLLLFFSVSFVELFSTSILFDLTTVGLLFCRLFLSHIKIPI